MEEAEPHWPPEAVRVVVVPFRHLDGWAVTIHLPGPLEEVDLRAVVKWVCEKLKFPPGRVVIVLSRGSEERRPPLGKGPKADESAA